MITPDQKRICKAIVSVFETGKAAPDYTACTILSDGAGISYGAHQATDRADSLDAILIRALDLGIGRAEEVRRVLALLQADATARYSSVASAPAEVRQAVALLRELGSDPIMQRAQEEVFEAGYWLPAQRQAEEMRLIHPLCWAIVYDTCIHSGPGGVARIRARFPEVPPVRGGDERAWAAAYVRARRAWLASRGGIVAATVYRMDAFLSLIGAGNWALTPPFRARGVVVA